MDVNRAPKVGRPRGRFLRWALIAIPVICLAYALVAYGDVEPPQAGRSPGGPSPANRPAPPPLPAEVTVSPQAEMTAVPPSYLGLSTEYWALPLWSAYTPLLERALSLMHVAGTGPLILRVGGDSADHSFWDPNAVPMPQWAFTLRPRWLAQASELVRGLGLKLILDLNLITDSPASAAQWARAAKAGLPRGSIIGFEVGNEPDIYTRANWLAITAGPRFAGRQFAGRPLPGALTVSDYVRDFHAYATALDQVAPHVMLSGPALANPVMHRAWVSSLIAGGGRSLGMVTIHRYPYSGCASRRFSRSYATIGRLLSPAATTGMAGDLVRVVDAAHDAGLALRMTELNSVNCGGRPGVSNAFATALWAPDALFALLRAGVDGINLHVRANTINAPFALTPAGLQARPLLYGLILFTRALGPRAQLVRLSSRHPRAANFAAWAVRVGSNTLHVVLIDKGRRSVRVSLRLPARSTASVQRLVAPSATSQTGVTLGGQSLGADGHWQGGAARQTVTPRSGSYTVQLRRQSAALLSVRVAPGSLGTPRQSRRLQRPRHPLRLGPPRHSRRLGPPRPSGRLGAPRHGATGARRPRAAGRAPEAARSQRR